MAATRWKRRICWMIAAMKPLHREPDTRAQQCVNHQISIQIAEQPLNGFLGKFALRHNLNRNTHLLEYGQVRGGVSANLFWSSEQQYQRLHAPQDQMTGHHKAVAAVVAFSTTNGDSEFSQVGKVRFQSANHSASSDSPLDETGNAIALGGQSINLTHLRSG
jgi:hypothetical protein